MSTSFFAGISAGIGLYAAYTWLANEGEKAAQRRRRERDHGQENNVDSALLTQGETSNFARNDDFCQTPIGMKDKKAVSPKEKECECPLCCNRYCKLKLLGEGSFGKTFLARDKKHTGTSINDQVALKIVRVSDIEELNMALDECTFLRAVNHTHIVRLHTSFAHKGTDGLDLVLVMDYASGGDLKQVIKEFEQNGSHMPEDQVLKFIAQLVDAVHYIHSNEILHRDLKTDNVLLTEATPLSVPSLNLKSSNRERSCSNLDHLISKLRRVHLQVADFGLSKFVDIQAKVQAMERAERRQHRRSTTSSAGGGLSDSSSSSSISISSSISKNQMFEDEIDPRFPMSQVGTKAYMAPEMKGSDEPRCNKKCDIWCLGCVVLELASCHFLEEKKPNESHKQWLNRHLATIPDHYSCRAALVSLIRIMLHDQPELRISTLELCRKPLVAVHLPATSTIRATIEPASSNEQRRWREMDDQNNGYLLKNRSSGTAELRRSTIRLPQSVPIRSKRSARMPTSPQYKRQRLLQSLTNKQGRPSITSSKTSIVPHRGKAKRRQKRQRLR